MEVTSSEGMRSYFNAMVKEFGEAFSTASKARSHGLDPEQEVEISPARDVAARVEGLVGPKGVGDRIRELSTSLSMEETAFQISKEIVERADWTGLKKSDSILALTVEEKELLIEGGVRSGLALFTEGVVSAPIEGISKFQVRKNPDGSDYLAVFYTGPIRGAGGTGQAFSLIIADYCRLLLGIGNYRPTEDEVERYVEEIALYSVRTRAGQYVPTDEEIRHVVRSCPVCVDGEPTEDYEVNVHKNLANVSTNRVRSGVCLVISEGVCLKAAKIIKITRRAKLDWLWLEKLIKVVKQDSKQTQVKPVEKYMEELVGGRPIFSYPMRNGGFRLRYGRSRFCGILSKGIHPASMILLDSFPVMGTQVKTERPGKGCVVTPCNSIEGPIVKLRNGEVKGVESSEEAEGLVREDAIEEILFLGDMLVCYGDFLKANHPLVPPGYCNEWHLLELRKAGVEINEAELLNQSAKEALAIAVKNNVPLSPKYTFHWSDLSIQELRELASWFCEEGIAEYEWFDFKSFKVKKNARGKRLLELLGIPHSVGVMEGQEYILFGYDNALAILSTLSLISDKKISKEKFELLYSEEKKPLEFLSELNGFKIMSKTGICIGTSMGRPEKSKERKMQPPVNCLFPLGEMGGKLRSFVRANKEMKNEEGAKLEVELELRNCTNCGKIGFLTKCRNCSEITLAIGKCASCGKVAKAGSEKCGCGGAIRNYGKQIVDLPKILEEAARKVSFKPEELKGVMGLISTAKCPEAIEKGILRSKYDLTVFRDGTCRYDATEIPMTHFIPGELGLGEKEETLSKLKKMGYDKDIRGKELESPEQTVELKCQDVVISHHAADYFMRVCGFVDDLLVYHYSLPPFYSLKNKNDLVGKLFIAIAPHTSAGVLCRVIGYTDSRALLAHPYLHCATRRNCDGDELCLILLQDALLNFSKKFLPETRGGKMDAPLVLTTILDPKEVDDEVHAMDACWEYPLEFYEACLRYANPAEVKLDIIASRLGKESQYEGIGFTHPTSISGPTMSSYVSLGTMRDKVLKELELMSKIRAVDVNNAAEKIILAHFFPDLYGNMRSFSKQTFRCGECNAKYRRVPLRGKCTKCGGKLLLTINKGGIEKYLKLSNEMITEYKLPDYLKQRLALLEKEIESVFEDDKSKQFALADFV